MSALPGNERTVSTQRLFEKELTRLSRANGFRWQLKLVNPRERNYPVLTELLSLNPQAVVVVSPLIVPDVEWLIKQFPENVFITFDPVLQHSSLSNLLTVNFDRRSIYEKIGRELASLVKNPAFIKKLKFPLPGTDVISPSPQLSASPLAADPGSIKLGILAGYATQSSRDELAGLKLGYSGTNPSTLVEEKEFIITPGSQPDLSAAIDEMYQANVRLFFLRMYNFTEPCLEIIKTKGGLVILEDSSHLQVNNSTILLSLEEDYLGSLGAALSQVVRGTRGFTVKNQSLSGEFLLNWSQSVQSK